MIDQLQSYFEEKFPQWQDISVLNPVDITSGWETEIISFDVAYFFKGERHYDNLIARFYPGHTGVYRARFEFDLLQSLHSVGYPVPHVHSVETEPEIFERPFIIMQRIIGSTMMDLMFSDNGLIDSKMAELFSALFVQLHRLDWKKMAIIPERYLQSDSQTLFTEHLSEQRKHIMKYDVEFLSPMIDWLVEKLHGITFLPVSLLHRDFHGTNILLDQGGNPFVIDWTAATLGDPRIDVAWSQLLARLHLDKKISETILEGYQKAASMSLDDMDYFTIDACLRRLSDILISLSKGADSLGMREDTTTEMKAGLGLLEVMHGMVKEITDLSIDEIKNKADFYRAK
jgi:aminoglycoside phosphotransferase (APT) family kinase protein